MRDDDRVDVLIGKARHLETFGGAVDALAEALPQLVLRLVVGVDAGVDQDLVSMSLEVREGMDVILRLARSGIPDFRAVEHLRAPRPDAVFDVGDLVGHLLAPFRFRRPTSHAGLPLKAKPHVAPEAERSSLKPAAPCPCR